MPKGKTDLVIAFFIAILVVGAFFRLYGLGQEGFGFGEVEVLQAVQEFMKGNLTNNFYIYAETPLHKYILTIFALAAGSASETTLRLVSAIFGIGAVILVFLLSDKLYKDRWIALFASLFTALSLIHIQFSRYVQFEAALSFFFLLAFYFFIRFIQNKTDKNAALLGLSIGLGMLIKTAFFMAIIALVIFAIIYGLIKLKIRPAFTLTIDNKLLKSLAVAVACFFILWPIALMTLPIDITVNVEGRINEVKANVPQLLLVFGYRFTEVNKATTDNFFLNLPLIGHFFFFLVKENLIFVAALFAGLLAIRKDFREQDKLIIIFLVVFFTLLWLQHVRFTYRYIAIVIPLLAIISARAIDFARPRKEAVLVVLFIAMIIYALFVSPNYGLYYNNLNSAFNVPESEGRFGEGMRAVVNELSNCSSIVAENFYVFMIEPYLPGAASPTRNSADCVLSGVGNGIANDNADKFLSTHTCPLTREIYVKNQKLFEVYRC